MRAPPQAGRHRSQSPPQEGQMSCRRQDQWDANFRSLAREAEKRSFWHKQTHYEFARVCSTRRYKTIKSSNQTNTCAEMAARYYYNKLFPGKFLMDLEPVDSHAFDRHGEDKNDRNIYFHINFRAKKHSRASPSSLFFAEIQGRNGPEKVTFCTELVSLVDLENCCFCTGICHPPGGFVGCMQP